MAEIHQKIPSPELSTSESSDSSQLTSLPFPPVTSTHILNCSFHSWYPNLRSKTPKARLVPLTQPFLEYLRSDGIVLPPEPAHDGDSGYSDDEEDVSQGWSEVHQQIFDTIETLGGKVIPKLNWSAPKGKSIYLLYHTCLHVRRNIYVEYERHGMSHTQ